MNVPPFNFRGSRSGREFEILRFCGGMLTGDLESGVEVIAPEGVREFRWNQPLLGDAPNFMIRLFRHGRHEIGPCLRENRPDSMTPLKPGTNLDESQMDPIPSSVKRLFWDVEKEGVDVRSHRFFIIKRIMDYGNQGDVQWMMKTYRPEEIMEVLRKSRGISRKSAYFWAAYFQVPREDVECLKEFYPRRLRPF